MQKTDKRAGGGSCSPPNLMKGLGPFTALGPGVRSIELLPHKPRHHHRACLAVPDGTAAQQGSKTQNAASESNSRPGTSALTRERSGRRQPSSKSCPLHHPSCLISACHAAKEEVSVSKRSRVLSPDLIRTPTSVRRLSAREHTLTLNIAIASGDDDDHPPLLTSAPSSRYTAAQQAAEAASMAHSPSR